MYRCVTLVLTLGWGQETFYVTLSQTKPSSLSLKVTPVTYSTHFPEFCKHESSVSDPIAISLEKLLQTGTMR